MSECFACAIAKVNPRAARFDAGCSECSARALAGDPRFHAATQSNTITPAYRAALQAVFGAGWKEGHERIKEWAKKMTSKT